MFRMEKHQELEWEEAQKIAISVDLVAAAKLQLRFLAEVRYKTDCEELYGRVLDNQNVLSSTRATCRKQPEEIWKRMYSDEPYELNICTHFPKNVENFQKTSKSTEYDLISAVNRQSPLFYQVSRSHMNDNLFLEEAAARYKGFLHLIKRNWEKSVRCLCVPTYDVDLIWHSHQLHPVSYSKDLVATLGKVLEHDDTDCGKTHLVKVLAGRSDVQRQCSISTSNQFVSIG
ncbi:hypothetical protein CRYUN_Cryun30bG0049600 [Craigia yunnanensis]